jgi:hypothetical protein
MKNIMMRELKKLLIIIERLIHYNGLDMMSVFIFLKNCIIGVVGGSTVFEN